MSKGNPKDDGTSIEEQGSPLHDEPIDYVDVFPATKIKSILQTEEDIGVIPSASVQYISAVSSVLVRNILDLCPPDGLLRYEDLRRVVHEEPRLHFLSSAIDGIKHDDNSDCLEKRKRQRLKRENQLAEKRKRKIEDEIQTKDPLLQDKVTRDAAAAVNKADQRTSPLKCNEVVFDEEDYDD